MTPDDWDYVPTDLDKAKLKISQLEDKDRINSQYIARLHVAYLCIVETHARLLLATTTNNGIADMLKNEYAFELPQDAHTDLRDVLNREVSMRAEDNRRMIRADSEALAS